MEKRCRNCAFKGKSVKAECRRFPPQAVYAFDGIRYVFPEIRDTSWCGEWRDVALRKIG